MQTNESTVEHAALSWFGDLGYATGHRPHMAPGEPGVGRDSFGDVVLLGGKAAKRTSMSTRMMLILTNTTTTMVTMVTTAATVGID